MTGLEKVQPGLDEACPCGSGKNHLDCCEQKPVGAVENSNSAQLLQMALDQHNAGRLLQAEELYRRLLESEPLHADALHLLGLIFHQSGNHQEAVRLIRLGLSVNDRVPDYHNNLGIVCNAMGRLDEAEAAFLDAVRLQPANSQMHDNLGSAQQHQGKLPEAIASYRRALELEPNRPVTWNNLGAALRNSGSKDAEEIAVCFKNAIALAPGYSEAMINLGNTLADSGQYRQALDSYRAAISAGGNSAVAHNNLGSALRRQGKTAEAIAAFKSAIAIAPDFLDAWSSYLFTLNYAEGYSRQAIFDEHLEFARRFEAPLKAAWRGHGNERDPGKKLKIGYLSGDFRRHAVAYFFEPVLANHGDGFESYCYHNNLISDEVTERLKSLAGHWREIGMLSDEAVAQLIREDGIDILVDLSGHSAGNRLLVFARKPAPLQASWLGYLCTTGLSAIDYRITDAYADPPGASERYHTERLIRLPGSFACYNPPQASPEVGPLPALENGLITFGSFNNLAKLEPKVLELWAKVLGAIPGSRLMLKAAALADVETRSRILGDFARHGIFDERLELVSWDADHFAHLDRYNRVDIGLDPFPCNGGTTSFDALWMGVPVVTLAGDRFISRMGASMAYTLGLAELVADSPGKYLKIAANLAGDLHRLSELRSGLRQRMRNSPLANAQLFTRNLEAAYRQIWQKWCEQ